MIEYLRKLRNLRISSSIREDQHDYNVFTRDQIAQHQLRKLNEIWQVAYTHIDYYKQLQVRKSLPDQFRSLSEFTERLPILNKHELVELQESMLDSRYPADASRATSGSTFKPITIPSWKIESQVASNNIWIGRSWLELVPEDRLFLLWGHGQLFGDGIRRHFSLNIRKLKDWFLGYHRASAYQLDRKSLKQQGINLLRFRPSYILGFSAALERFAEVNADLKNEFSGLNLKYIIATGECFTSQSAKQNVQQIFGCPVVMEYGAVETGPIAYQTSSSKYSTFWKNFLVETQESADAPGFDELLVTCLFPRKLPLIRYRIGDLVSAPEKIDVSTLGFKEVLGRTQELVKFSNGDVKHIQVIDNVLRHFRFISRYRVENQLPNDPMLLVSLTENAPETALVEIKNGLENDQHELSKLVIHERQQLPLSVAGKQIRISNA